MKEELIKMTQEDFEDTQNIKFQSILKLNRMKFIWFGLITRLAI